MTSNPTSPSGSNGNPRSQNPSWHTPELAAEAKAWGEKIHKALNNSRAAEIAKQEQEEMLRTTTPEQRARCRDLVLKAVLEAGQAQELED